MLGWNWYGYNIITHDVLIVGAGDIKHEPHNFLQFDPPPPLVAMTSLISINLPYMEIKCLCSHLVILTYSHQSFIKIEKWLTIWCIMIIDYVKILSSFCGEGGGVTWWMAIFMWLLLTLNKMVLQLFFYQTFIMFIHFYYILLWTMKK